MSYPLALPTFTYARTLPSGENENGIPLSPSGSSGPLPSTGFQNNATLPVRVEVNAMRRPSGVQIGQRLPPPTVIRVRVPRAMSYTQMSVSGSATVYAMRMPSGDKRGWLCVATDTSIDSVFPLRSAHTSEFAGGPALRQKTIDPVRETS